MTKYKQTGVQLILDERIRQTEKLGWSLAHDVEEHTNGELSLAAIAYTAPRDVYIRNENRTTVLFQDPFPWEPEFDKRYDLGKDREDIGCTIPKINTWTQQERIEMLTKAGALIAAEIDRLQALTLKEAK